MALDTYSALQSSVAAWLSRDDLTSIIPDLIVLAESRMSRVLRVQQMVQTTTGTLAADSFTLPTGFLEVAGFTLLGTPRAGANYVPPETFFALTELTQTGRPRFCTVLNGKLYVGPIPTAPGEDYQLTYYTAIPALATNDPNWLLAKAPDAYLFGSLLEAEPYLQNDERVPLWQQRFDMAVAQLNGNDLRLRARGMAQRARTA